MYPIAISHAGRVIPRSLVTGAIGWITAAGAAGSALLPFLTGTVAGKLGVGALQPL
jgi:fucose permease